MTTTTTRYFARMSGSDRYPYEVVEVVGPKRVLVRQMDYELDPEWKPKWVAGGFAGHCENCGSQRWICTSRPDRVPVELRLYKHGKNGYAWRDREGNPYYETDVATRYHDYNF